MERRQLDMARMGRTSQEVRELKSFRILSWSPDVRRTSQEVRELKLWN